MFNGVNLGNSKERKGKFCTLEDNGICIALYHSRSPRVQRCSEVNGCKVKPWFQSHVTEICCLFSYTIKKDFGHIMGKRDSPCFVLATPWAPIHIIPTVPPCCGAIFSPERLQTRQRTVSLNSERARAPVINPSSSPQPLIKVASWSEQTSRVSSLLQGFLSASQSLRHYGKPHHIALYRLLRSFSCAARGDRR
jgi:hypothetical protein